MRKNFLFSMLAVLLAGFWFGGVSLADTVAEIGETPYTSLGDAINNAQSGDTVILLKDVSETISLTTGKSITLNLSGHKITTGSTAVSISAGILTVEGNGSIDVTSKGSNVFSVSGGGKLIVKNGTFTGGGGVYVKGNGSEATIENGSFVGVRSGNSALMHATNSGKLTILTGYFKGMPTGSGKPQKVIYAGGNGNYCDSRSRIMADSGYRIGGTVIVKGGTLIGRVSLSNEGIYDIQRGTFTLYGNLTAGVGCNYSVCESDGTGDPLCNDNAPGIENMLGEGYVGVPKGTNEDGSSIYEVVYDPVAIIGENGYSTVIGAITAAQDDDIIEIVKAGNSYTLPASIDKKITIKKGSNLSELDDVVINISGAGKANGEALVTLTKDITFEGLTINFVSTDDWKYLNNTTKVTMKHCKIQGVMYVRGNMDFEDCTFEGASSDAYQIHINYGNVNFSGCTFNTEAKRFINIAWGGDGEYTINFKNSTFSTTATAVKKAAVMVHELRGAYATYDPFDFRPVTDFETIGGKDYGKGKWNLIFDNTVIADGSNFSDAYIGNSQLFGVDTVYVNDFDGTTYTYAAPVDPTDGGVNLDYLGSENGGEVNVTVNGTKVYSTPKRGQTWKVTFDGTGDQVVADGAKVAQPADPSKSCYHFDGWYNGNTAYDFNSVVTGNLALTSKWTYACGSSSSSSSSSKKTSTTKVDDNKTTTEEVNTEDKTEENNDEAKTEETLPQLASQEELQNPEAQDWYDNEGDQQEVLEDGLTREMHNAYEFAVRAGITTMPSATEADMLSPLNRIAMAKMLVYYAINVLGMTPDTSKEVPNFGDVSEQLNKDYGNAVTLAYQLGIMGIGITDFRPFDEVPRMEFATALSRMLYGTADGEGDNYYEPHLQKLMSEGIITNDNPRLDELRGYVMIMLMRSANK